MLEERKAELRDKHVLTFETVRLCAMAGRWAILDDAAAADAGVDMMFAYRYIYVKNNKGR